MTDGLPIAPHTIAGWVPVAKMAGFFLAACTFEDVAAIGAGLMLAAGDISWLAAFSACFLGIWCGDTSLYGIARIGGRGWLERSRWRRFGPKVARSERWFTARGTPILIFSRMIPAARLPTYFAAGFLRVPLPRFLLITGIASFVWTFVVLFLAKTFGERLVHWLNVYQHTGLALIGAALGVFIGLRLLRRMATSFFASRKLRNPSRRLLLNAGGTCDSIGTCPPKTFSRE